MTDKTLQARVTALVVVLLLLAGCETGNPPSRPTPTHRPLPAYRAPGGKNWGTLNGQVRMTMDMTGGEATINGVGVTMDTGERIQALLQPGILEKIESGVRVRVAPVDHPEFEWQVVEASPIMASNPIISKVDGTVELGFIVEDLAVGNAAVWVAGHPDGADDKKRLARIDPQTGQVIKTAPLAKYTKDWPLAITVAEGTLWIVGWDALYRIDPEKMTVSETWPVGNYGDNFVIQDGIAWLSGSDADDPGIKTLVRYDLTTKTATSAAMSGTVRFLAASENSIWAATKAETSGSKIGLARVSRETGQVIDTTYYDPYAPAYGIAVGGGSIWLALDMGGDIAQFDAESGELLSLIPVVGYEELRPDSELRGIAYGEGAVWVGHPASGSLIRIDPETKVVTHVISAEEQVRYPQVGMGRVWMITGLDTISWVDMSNLVTDN